MTNQSAMNDVS